MASLPSLNYREHDLLKKIVENTYGGCVSSADIEQAVRDSINKDPFGRKRVSQHSTLTWRELL